MWGVDFPHPYMALYNASATALKAVDDQLRVGGPATMQTQDVGDFIARCQQSKIPVDFVSTHFYPTDPQCQTNTTKSHVDCFSETVLAAQKLAAAADLPFLLTEYNNGLGQTSRDDSSAAAFVYRQMGRMQALDVFSWWTFSDVFEEGWMRSAPFHNGYGMMTVQGTRKPVWRAFEALHGAGDARFGASVADSAGAGATVSVLATNGGGGALGAQLFVSEWHRVDAVRYGCDAATKTCKEDPQGAFTDEALCNENCPPSGGEDGSGGGSSLLGRGLAASSSDPFARNVTVTVQLRAGQHVPATVSVGRIDATHANPQQAWIDMGSPTYPTPKQIAALDAASVVHAEAVPTTRVSATSFTITVELGAYAAVHVVM